MLHNLSLIKYFFSDKSLAIKRVLISAVIALVSGLLGYFIPSLISASLVIIIEIAFGILLGCLLVLILMYHKEINTDVIAALTTIENRDISISKKEKTISITNTDFENKICQVVTEIDVENQMTERYEKYLFGIESDCYVPDFAEIKIQEGTHRPEGLPDNSEYIMKVHKSFDPKTNQEGKISIVECDFYIPLNLDFKHNKTIKVFYPTKAFNGIFQAKREETSMKVLQKTGKLQFNIKIDKYLKMDYGLSEEVNRNENGEYISYNVIDSSKRRMLPYEKKLKDTNCIPHFSKEEIKWVIPNPMVGYTYLLFFTLEAEEKPKPGKSKPGKSRRRR